MQSHKILFVVLLVFGLIGAIRTSDPLNSDDLFFMHINVNNEGTKDLDDLSVRVLFYDLGIIFQTNSFDLDDRDTAGKLIFWDVPNNVEPGDYLVRITVSNDDVREVRHRIVTIA
jgi:uncharacterized membrane protein